MERNREPWGWTDPLQRCRKRKLDMIFGPGIMDHQKIEWGGVVVWIDVAEDMDNWLAVVKTVTNLLVQ
jgi:hypothetical protein